MLRLTTSESSRMIAQRSATHRLANALMYLSAFCASWTAVAVGGNNVVDYLLVAATLAALAARVISRRLIFVDLWMVLPTLAALLVVVWDVTVQGARSGEAESITRILFATGFVAVLVTASYAEGGRRTMLRILGWWTAGVAACALATVGQGLGIVSFAGILDHPTGSRASGLSSHPNSVAFSITLAVPVFILLIRVARGTTAKLCWGASLCVAFGGLAFSGSRSGLLVALPALGLALLLALVSSRLRVLALPVLILGGIATVALLPPILRDTRLVQGAMDSDAGRMLLNSSAGRLFVGHPIFGAGFDSQAGVAVPLMVVSAGGVVLALGYYLFVFRPLPILWRSRRDPVGMTGILVLGAFLMFGLLNPVFVERATFWPILACACWALQGHNRAEVSPWRISSRAA